MALDLITREGVLAFYEHSKRVLLGEYPTQGRVLPHAIVLCTKDPDTGKRLEGTGVAFVFPEPSMLQSADTKDAYAKAIANVIERGHACGVIVIMEAWYSGPLSEKERAALPESLNTPFAGRREGIVIQLEHIALERPILAVAPIERTASGSGIANPFEEHHSEVEGRFSHLLKRCAS